MVSCIQAKRGLAIGFLILIAVSPVLVYRVAAANGGLSLPSTLINIVVTNGTQSYFNTTLTNVPSGYDVTNQTYPGWCIDLTANMTRNVAFDVNLYSSLSPQGSLSSVRWDMVNYILNHKQGNSDDIQQAIWYFANMSGTFNFNSTVAHAIVNDALANGTGFTPATGQNVAVICYPIVLVPYPVQVSIIEIPYPNSAVPEFPTVAIPVLFALATLSTIIIRKGNAAHTKPKKPEQHQNT